MFTVTQSCPALRGPRAYSLPGSSVHGISHARILGQIAISYSGDLPDTGIEPTALASPALAGGFFTTCTIWEAPLILAIHIGMWWTTGKWQKFISHSSRGQEIQNQGTSNVGFILRPPLLAYRQLPSLWVLIWPLYRKKERRKQTLWFFFLKIFNSNMRVLPPWLYLTLITSQRPHLQISSHWSLRLQDINWGGGLINPNLWQKQVFSLATFASS